MYLPSGLFTRVFFTLNKLTEHSMPPKYFAGRVLEFVCSRSLWKFEAKFVRNRNKSLSPAA